MRLLYAVPLLLALPAHAQPAPSAAPAEAVTVPALPPGHPPTNLPPGHPPTGGAATPALPPGHPPTTAAPAGSALPPGHPPTNTATGAPAGSALPPGHPPTTAATAAGSAAPAASALPPGHPPTTGSARPTSAAAAADPHGGTIPRDESTSAPDVPAGTVDVTILDGKGAPLPRTSVRLGIMFQKISEGESRSEKFATTDEAGRVRFSGLNIGSEYSYRITVKSGPADYGSPPFNLGEGAGHRVRLHILPVTTSLDEAAVGIRGYVYIEPRDDVFQFEALFRVFNVGAVTWVPKDVVMALPEGFKAFSAQREMTGVGFVSAPGGARLEGTFTPGQHDVRFRFQVPKSASDSASFRVGLLPRVFNLGVIAEASSQMQLSVDGFHPAEPGSNPQGKRVLVTRRDFSRADTTNAIVVHLSGLPVPGPGRWIAVLIATALGLTGFAAVRGVVQLESGSEAVRNRDLENARELLLNELVEVEKAHRRGDLGPRAYAEARRTLLESLTRLGPEALSTSQKPKRKRSRDREASRERRETA